MPKKPFFRAFDGWWYAQVRVGGKRKQIKLVRGRENKAEAYKKFFEVMADLGSIPEPTKLTIDDVCRLFLSFSQKNHQPETYNFYRFFLLSFSGQYGSLKATAIIPLHVTRWMDAFGWNCTTRNRAASSVKRAFNHAVQEGVLKDSPIHRLRKDQPQRRERTLTPDERKELYSLIPDQAFRRYLFALQESGARPGEIRKVSREQLHLDAGLWVFSKHKTVKKTGKPRVIYLTPAMLQLTKDLLSIGAFGSRVGS